MVHESGALLHKEVSAKKNQGVNEVLQKVGEAIIKHPSNAAKSASRKGSHKLKSSSVKSVKSQ